MFVIMLVFLAIWDSFAALTRAIPTVTRISGGRYGWVVWLIWLAFGDHLRRERGDTWHQVGPWRIVSSTASRPTRKR
jgi:hypothetical protein